MEVWPNWAARWTQLQPSPSIKDGSAPYFMSCTTMDRWPCLRETQKDTNISLQELQKLILTSYSDIWLLTAPSEWCSNVFYLSFGNIKEWIVFNKSEVKKAKAVLKTLSGWPGYSQRDHTHIPTAVKLLYLHRKWCMVVWTEAAGSYHWMYDFVVCYYFYCIEYIAFLNISWWQSLSILQTSTTGQLNIE